MGKRQDRPLSEKQVELLEFIKQFIDEKGYSPGLREMMAAAGVSSPSPIQARLAALKRKGLVDWVPGGSRTVHLVKRKEKE